MSGGTIAAGEQTVANYGLAASFAAVNAAMGPIGWALLAAGLVGAGAIGFGMAGGLGVGGGATPAAGQEVTNIYMSNVNMQTKADAEKTAQELATYYQHHRRAYGSSGR